jgi:hypothetical protein
MLLAGSVFGTRKDSASDSMVSLLTFTLLPAATTAVSNYSSLDLHDKYITLTIIDKR